MRTRIETGMLKSCRLMGCWLSAVVVIQAGYWCTPQPAAAQDLPWNQERTYEPAVPGEVERAPLPDAGGGTGTQLPDAAGASEAGRAPQPAPGIGIEPGQPAPQDQLAPVTEETAIPSPSVPPPATTAPFPNLDELPSDEETPAAAKAPAAEGEGVAREDAADTGDAGQETEGPKASPDAQPLPQSAAVIPPEAVQIQWRVENPFRFFTDPKDTNVHRATYLALSPQQRKNPVLSSERALSARHPEGWAVTMFRKTCWNRSSNRFSCPDGSDYINPEKHTIVAELAGVHEPSINCIWRVNPKDKSTRPLAVTKPCEEPLLVDVPYPEGVELLVEIGGLPVAKTDVKVLDILIAGMGDSFASGEGNPDGPVRFSRERTASYGGGGKELVGYPARVGAWRRIGDKAFIEQNARWLDQACHRSLYSFELRAALQLSLEDPHRAVTYVGVACSGAEVTAGLFLRYKGNEWVPNPPALSQISALAEAQCGSSTAPAVDLPEAYHMRGSIPELDGGLVLRKCDVEKARKIDLLLVSIGGNDIGFSRLLANSVLAEKSLLKKLGGWFGEIDGDSHAQSSRAVDRVDQRYKSLNRALHSVLHMPWDESDRIILAAYPPLALLGDGSATCPDGTAGMEILPDFRLSKKKAEDGDFIADKLHNVMRKTAQVYGWSFAQDHRDAFIGRGICAGYVDNAFSIADDLRLPRMVNGKWEPYNPADFRPYASRQRWFRTPNDAFMTGNFHVSGSILQKALRLESLSWFQLLLASTYSGAFHPTAEGHAAMADSVTDKARQVLRKYRQESPALTAKANSVERAPLLPAMP